MTEPEKMENAVQPKGWFSALPRPIYKTLEKVDTGNPWFEVYKLPAAVYAIYEPGQFQEVISFLVLGSEKAVLIDTGMGMGNIKSVTDKLTDKKVSVLNTHSHFDHLGDNYRFDDVAVFDNPETIKTLTDGAGHERLKRNIEGDSVWMPYPEGFDPNNYVIPGKAPTRLLHDGDVIDLGNRELEVMHTPGHSDDSVMFLDRKNGILFTGDTYYPAPLYAHTGTSNLKTYAATMAKVAELAPAIKYIYPSHNEPIVSPEVLPKVAAALQTVLAGGHPFKVDSHGLRRYDFGGNLSVITKDE
jgi:glyoxylase-like metal-dependent hydrolase (beta-lactamase superfamily II)